MTYNVLILFTKINSPIMLGLELYDSLARYKELKIYFRHVYFVSKEDINLYDVVIPVDVTSQQYYNSLEHSKFFSSFTNIYELLDNKASCYQIVKKHRQVRQIPTYTTDSKYSLQEFIEKNDSDRYIIKSNTGYAAFYQTILNKKQLLRKTKNSLKNCIVQPKFENFKLYSLDAVCKNGTIISDLFTIVGDNGLQFTDFVLGSIKTRVIDDPKLYNSAKKFSDAVIKECNYSGLIEFEFIITDDNKIYFLEINPRICGHIGQKDVNRNSIYYNKIIIPYFKEYGITLPQQLTVTDEYEGSNVRNIIPLMFNLNPILFITIGVIYAYVVILIIKKTGILNKI